MNIKTTKANIPVIDQSKVSQEQHQHQPVKEVVRSDDALIDKTGNGHEHTGLLDKLSSYASALVAYFVAPADAKEIIKEEDSHHNKKGLCRNKIVVGVFYNENNELGIATK